MGEHQGGGAQPNGLLPNGVLGNEATPVIGVIDSEKWLKAEERTAEIIACIQPNQPSEDLRNAVADYVQRLITKCFPCQVFTYGSVPLKTYLPDGDIDLTTFCNNENVKETWANVVHDTLEKEEKDENAEFRVKEIQFIQAEVKIIKCLVENIVVDISFNQLGGLCTLCFLEEVDNLINHNHLFKRSIILIKAWCYYESRILGAHHGLISTYALETLVLYIFHLNNNSFAGPLEVLYHFLQFFSKFDWENFCVSLRGPVPIHLLPDMTAEPPRKDGGKLLLRPTFLDACSSVYAVFPGGQDNQGQPFVSKYFNVIDPLRINNNLGRSVSKGNFYRIRSAFAFGAKKMSRLLDCPKEEVHSEVNNFFINTWDRHGSGNRPDTPRNDLQLRLCKSSYLHKSEDHENRPCSEIVKKHLHDTKIEMNEISHTVSSQNGNSPLEKQSKFSNQMTQDVRPDQGVHLYKGQNSLKVNMVNNVKGINPFVRTRSSPELTDSYVNASSRGRRNRTTESGKIQISAAGFDAIRKNLGPEVFANKNIESSVDDHSYKVKHVSSRQNTDDKAEAICTSNSGHSNSRVTVLGEEPAPVVGTQGMLQEEQDFVNIMASSIGPGFNGQVHMHMKMAPPHFPPPFPQAFLHSMGHVQRNFAGMLPSNFPFTDHPWASSMQFPPGRAPSPMAHYYPDTGLTANRADLVEKQPAEESCSEEGIHDVWQENDRGSVSSFDLSNGSVEMNHLDTQNPSTSASINSSSLFNSGNHSKDQMKLTREFRGSKGENLSDIVQSTGNQRNDVQSNERTASPRFFRTSFSKSKTSSEVSWDGSSVKTLKQENEKRGRKSAISQGSDVHQNLSHQGDNYDRDWDSLSNKSCEVSEISTGSHAVPLLNDQIHHSLSLEQAHRSVSDTMIPVPPMFLGLGPRPNSGTLKFYPTGPPIPFITFCNFPPETSSRVGGEDGFDSSASGQNISSTDELGKSKLIYMSGSMGRSGSTEGAEQHKCDILNSDFSSHLQNLHFGRYCQIPRSQVPLLYHSPVTVPPMYLQGHFPWDGPGRPLSTNMNMFPQTYGPRIVPAASLQNLFNRPNVYQPYVDEMPKHRSGTGTYLPNHVYGDKHEHPSESRRGSYSYDRNVDNHGDRNDREGNWNTNSKTRASGRNYSRNQAGRASSRIDRPAASESRADRSWTSNRPEVSPSYQSQSGPQCGTSNVAYGMSSNGPTVMMLYPYDQYSHYGSHAEQLEFGSLGPVDFSGMNSSSPLSPVSQSSEALEEQQVHGNSVQQSSSDQPSSPHAAR